MCYKRKRLYAHSQDDYENDARYRMSYMGSVVNLNRAENGRVKEINAEKVYSNNIRETSYFDMRKNKRFAKGEIKNFPVLKNCRVVIEEELQRKPLYRYEKELDAWMYCWFLENVLPSVSYQIWYAMKILEQEKKWSLVEEIVEQLSFPRVFAMRQYTENPGIINAKVLSKEVPVSHDELANFFVLSLDSEEHPKRNKNKVTEKCFSQETQQNEKQGLRYDHMKNYEYQFSSTKQGRVSSSFTLSRFEKLRLFSRVMSVEIGFLLKWTIVLLEQLYLINKKSILEDEEIQVKTERCMRFPPKFIKTSFSFKNSIDTTNESSGSTTSLCKSMNSYERYYSIEEVDKMPILGGGLDYCMEHTSGKEICQLESEGLLHLSSIDKEEFTTAIMDPKLNRTFYEPALQELENESLIAMQKISKSVLIELLEDGIVEHVSINDSPLASGTNDISSVKNLGSSTVNSFRIIPRYLKYLKISPAKDNKKLLLNQLEESDCKKSLLFPKGYEVSKLKNLPFGNQIIKNENAKSFPNLELKTSPKRSTKYVTSKRKLWYQKWNNELSKSMVHFVEKFPSGTSLEEKVKWEELERDLLNLFKTLKSVPVPYDKEVFGTLKLPPSSLKTRYILFKRDCPLKYGKNPRLWDYGKAIQFLKDMCLETDALQRKFVSLQQGEFAPSRKRKTLEQSITHTQKKRHTYQNAFNKFSLSNQEQVKLIKIYSPNTIAFKSSHSSVKKKVCPSLVEQELDNYNFENITKERIDNDEISVPLSKESLTIPSCDNFSCEQIPTSSEERKILDKTTDGKFSILREGVLKKSIPAKKLQDFKRTIISHIEEVNVSKNNDFNSNSSQTRGENKNMLTGNVLTKNKSLLSPFQDFIENLKANNSSNNITASKALKFDINDSRHFNPSFDSNSAIRDTACVPTNKAPKSSSKNIYTTDTKQSRTPNKKKQNEQERKVFTFDDHGCSTQKNANCVAYEKEIPIRSEKCLPAIKVNNMIDVATCHESENDQRSESDPKISHISCDNFTNSLEHKKEVGKTLLDEFFLFAEHKLNEFSYYFSGSQLELVEKMLFSMADFSCSRTLEENEKWCKKIQQRNEILHLLSEQIVESEKVKATLMGKLENKNRKLDELQKTIRILQDITLRKDFKLCEYESGFNSM